jgi:hypothetical protein
VEPPATGDTTYLASIRNECIHLRLNRGRSDETDLGQGYLTLAIDHNQGGHSTHPKNSGGLPSYAAHHVQPDHLGPAI